MLRSLHLPYTKEMGRKALHYQIFSGNAPESEQQRLEARYDEAVVYNERSVISTPDHYIWV